MSKAGTSLNRLLRPCSLAVFGGHVAAVAIEQAEKMGFAGEIWPVHPQRGEIAGRRTFRCVADLPAPPDAAFVGVNRHASIEVMAALSAVGAGGAVAYASGFAETSEAGRRLQHNLVEAAGDMPFFGPNCYGFVNYFDNALVWPDQHGGHRVERGVAIITQSGNIGLNITMQKRGLPLGYMITLGNQAAIGPADAMHAVLDDKRVTAIGLHMESLGDPVELAHAVARSRAQNVPVVALKTGASEAGAHIALSHTASLASDDAVVNAYFCRIGLARIGTIPALLETLKLLHVHGALLNGTIASLSCSGGEAALMADTAHRLGVQMAPLSERARTAIAATLPELVGVANPLDYHTFGWRNRQALTQTFAAMMRAGAGLTMLVLDFPRADRCDAADWDVAADALADAAESTRRPAAVLATLPETMPEDRASAMLARGIAPLSGMEDALLAVRAAAKAALPAGGSFLPPCQPTSSVQARTFSEWDGKTLLASSGVKIPAGALAQTAEQAAQAARDLGFPVAIKAVGSDMAHKTERNAVRLNLGTLADAESTAASLLPLTGTVLVERMVGKSVVELIVGVSRDPVLGLFLMVGAGGIFAEFLADTAILLLPATRDDIAQTLGALRIAKLLDGFRGAPAADTPAAIDAIMAIQSFALKNAACLQELDVNPLIVCAQGHGAFAADVLLRMTENA